MPIKLVMFAKEPKPTPDEIKRFLEDENPKKDALEGVKRQYMEKFVRMYELLETHVMEEDEKLEKHKEHIDNEKAILTKSSEKAKDYRTLLEKSAGAAFHVL